jgi:hypothetical protein
MVWLLLFFIGEERLHYIKIKIFISALNIEYF